MELLISEEDKRQILLQISSNLYNGDLEKEFNAVVKKLNKENIFDKIEDTFEIGEDSKGLKIKLIYMTIIITMLIIRTREINSKGFLKDLINEF